MQDGFKFRQKRTFRPLFCVRMTSTGGFFIPFGYSLSQGIPYVRNIIIPQFGRENPAPTVISGGMTSPVRFNERIN